MIGTLVMLRECMRMRICGEGGSDGELILGEVNRRLFFADGEVPALESLLLLELARFEELQACLGDDAPEGGGET
jgi:hypothetical protein